MILKKRKVNINLMELQKMPNPRRGHKMSLRPAPLPPALLAPHSRPELAPLSSPRSPRPAEPPPARGSSAACAALGRGGKAGRQSALLTECAKLQGCYKDNASFTISFNILPLTCVGTYKSTGNRRASSSPEVSEKKSMDSYQSLQ